MAQVSVTVSPAGKISVSSPKRTRGTSILERSRAIARRGNATRAHTIQVDFKVANPVPLTDAPEHEFEVDPMSGRITDWSEYPRAYDTKTPIAFPARLAVQNIGGVWMQAAHIQALLAQNRRVAAYTARKHDAMGGRAFEYLVLHVGKEEM
jgi:hypothetical protein